MAGLESTPPEIRRRRAIFQSAPFGAVYVFYPTNELSLMLATISNLARTYGRIDLSFHPWDVWTMHRLRERERGSVVFDPNMFKAAMKTAHEWTEFVRLVDYHGGLDLAEQRSKDAWKGK